LSIVKKVFGVLLVVIGIGAAVAWMFQEGPHYESAQAAGMAGDRVEQGRMLWQPEPGFIGHALATEVIALCLGIVGVVLVSKDRGLE